jgi:hypothetical protein
VTETSDFVVIASVERIRVHEPGEAALSEIGHRRVERADAARHRKERHEACGEREQKAEQNDPRA